MKRIELPKPPIPPFVYQELFNDTSEDYIKYLTRKYYMDTNTLVCFRGP